jgi:hypothetical protein
MSVTLCVECYPPGDDIEAYSMVPIAPCAVCGRFDTRSEGGLRCNVLARDPRDLNPRAAWPFPEKKNAGGTAA